MVPVCDRRRARGRYDAVGTCPAAPAAGSNRGGVEPWRLAGTAHSQHETRTKEGRAGAPPNRCSGPAWSRAAGGGGDAKDRWLSSCRAAGAGVRGGHLGRAIGVRRDVGCADRSWGWPPVGQGGHEMASAASWAGRRASAGGGGRAEGGTGCPSTAPDPLPTCSLASGGASAVDKPVTDRRPSNRACGVCLHSGPRTAISALAALEKRLSKSRVRHPS